MNSDFFAQGLEIGRVLKKQGVKLATAESCTGGWVSQVITQVSGSSAWFDRGFVTYSNEAKQDMLKVKATTLATEGAVSEATAIEMAEGAIKQSLAELSLSITGIAGPAGGTAEKPVGTVCFAWARTAQPSKASTQQFSGDRNSIREQAVHFAISELIDYVRDTQ